MMFLLFENKMLRRIIPRYIQCNDESNKDPIYQRYSNLPSCYYISINHRNICSCFYKISIDFFGCRIPIIGLTYLKVCYCPRPEPRFLSASVFVLSVFGVCGLREYCFRHCIGYIVE
jgi:hypothetical protein